MPDILRTATPMGDWRSFPIVCDESAGWTSGTFLKRGDTYGIVFESVAIGESTVLIYEAEKIMVPKKIGSGEAFATRGAYVYLDPATLDVSPNFVSGYLRVGIVVEPATEDDERVMIDLYGHNPA